MCLAQSLNYSSRKASSEVENDVYSSRKKEFDGRRKFKRSMNVELPVDAMELAEHVDQIVLFSGDGDFRPLVHAVQRRGVRVTVVSTIASQAPMIADDLRRQADVFLDLAELSRRSAAKSRLRVLLGRDKWSSR